MIRGAVLVLAMLGASRAEALQVALLRADGVATLHSLPADLRTPLGSLWKLFVHAYQVDAAIADRPYACSGGDREEVYCCDPGETISRERALVQSCGLYFAPARLGIDAARWRAYWSAREAPAWLRDLDAMQPATDVAVIELLHALQRLPARDEAQRVLLDVVLEARDARVVEALGGAWRVKTWSWQRGETRIGGFAGWGPDGVVVWAGGDGTGQSVLSAFAKDVSSSTDISTMSAPSDGCVNVTLFKRYPVANIDAKPGRLRGTHLVTFTNGNTLDIASAGDIVLDANKTLRLRTTREDYVARVLDREAAPSPPQAARALAVAIRSYLQQNATRDGECLAIDDSSATQRVAPRPPTDASKEIAAFTRDLVLNGEPIRYHRDTASPGVLSWQGAVAQANAGATWRALLSQAYPRATLARWDAPRASCEPLPAAREWLLAQQAKWRRTLQREVGYAEPVDVETCKLQRGRPHVDRAQRRIHVRALATQQDRLDLAHEYLHLAFEAHPNGQDEAWVEALARRLLLETP